MVQPCSFFSLSEHLEKGCKLMTSWKKGRPFSCRDIIHCVPSKKKRPICAQYHQSSRQADKCGNGKGKSKRIGLQCNARTTCVGKCNGSLFWGAFSWEFSKALEWNAWNFICYATITTTASSYNHQPESSASFLHCRLWLLPALGKRLGKTWREEDDASGRIPSGIEGKNRIVVNDRRARARPKSLFWLRWKVPQLKKFPCHIIHKSYNNNNLCLVVPGVSGGALAPCVTQ